MEEKKNLYAVVIVIAVVGLLLSCVAGALAGGIVGLLVGRDQARSVAERTVQGALPWFEEEVPVPVPEPEDELPPLDLPPTGMRGARITEVLPGTPAEEAGLSAGDIITAVDRTPVNPNHQLSDVVAQYEPGDRATLTVWRSRQSERIRVTFGENPGAPGQPYLGIFYRMMGPNFESPGG